MPYHISKDKFSWPLDTHALTVLLSFDNRLPPSAVPKDAFICLFSLFENHEYECTVGISGEHGGEVVLRHMRLEGNEGYKREFVQSERFLGRGVGAVTLVFQKGVASLYLDGYLVTEGAFDYTAFTRIYIGACEIFIDGDVFTHGPEGSDDAGNVIKLAAIPRTFTYPEVLRMIPLYGGPIAIRAVAALEPFILFESGLGEIADFFDGVKDSTTFGTFAANLTYALERVLMDFPDGSRFIESEVRDKVYDLCLNPHSIHKREEYERSSRTDLAMHFATKFEPTDEGAVETDTYRIEFKIWGREGYDQLPKQPLSYMSAKEAVGASVMIDQRKKPDIQQFKDIVAGSKEFPCLEVSDANYLGSNIPSFASLHEDKKYANPRLIFNFYLHIPTAVISKD